MRNVIIKRNKSFVGCLSKLKVYIEDYTYGETKIGGVPCRKLGTLKNGEEKAFLIPDNAAKIFVIADSLSKNFCNEFYNLPEGQYDIYLSGQCRYNPASGNAFRFDGVTDESVIKNRKKGTKIGIVVLILAIIVGFIIGFIPNFIGGNGDTKQFKCDEMQITLTDEFMKVPVSGFDACFANDEIVILVTRDDLDVLYDLEEYSLKEYGDLVGLNIEDYGYYFTFNLSKKKARTIMALIESKLDLNDALVLGKMRKLEYKIGYMKQNKK